MIIMNGRVIKNKTINDLKTRTKDNKGLVVIQIGDNYGSRIYIKQKEKMAEELNILFKSEVLEENVDTDAVIEKIQNYNNDLNYSGILVQLPLPKHLNQDRILAAIAPSKDVDGLRNDSKYLPCTVVGVLELFKYYQIDLNNKKIVIVGKSRIVGTPLYKYFKNLNLNVILCDSKTIDLKTETIKADVLISAVGKPCFITEDMVRKEAVVIDVGISRSYGKLVGDVDFERVKTKCSYITPTPGGCGPATIGGLALNLYFEEEKEI